MARYLLAYDAGCGPCSRFKDAVGLLDTRGRIGFVSIAEADAAGMLEGIEARERYRAFHLVGPDGGASSGADALVPLARIVLPWGTLVGRAAEAVPGMRRAIRFGYVALARMHDSGACGEAGR